MSRKSSREACGDRKHRKEGEMRQEGQAARRPLQILNFILRALGSDWRLPNWKSLLSRGPGAGRAVRVAEGSWLWRHTKDSILRKRWDCDGETRGGSIPRGPTLYLGSGRELDESREAEAHTRDSGSRPLSLCMGHSFFLECLSLSCLTGNG